MSKSQARSQAGKERPQWMRSTRAKRGSSSGKSKPHVRPSTLPPLTFLSALTIRGRPLLTIKHALGPVGADSTDAAIISTCMQMPTKSISSNGYVRAPASIAKSHGINMQRLCTMPLPRLSLFDDCDLVARGYQIVPNKITPEQLRQSLIAAQNAIIKHRQ